ncbi:MAG: RluA family pseudouridine synthase [Candidatus Omnitrophica bacterium]|nr:RluA family pseudouridine synthase [Candidatus Omnitrophota bacterium]
MIPVLYEDQWLLVADKPSGILVIPAPGDQKRTLTALLNEQLPKGALYRLHPCHRLDRDTSGLIIYAKGKSIQQRMMDEFKNKRVKRTYMAVTQGRMPAPSGEIHKPIEGKPSLTRYRVIRQGPDFSVVEVSPVTGRTNQIRIHLRQIGSPILGDTRFVFRRHFRIKVNRLMLHARALEFVHPVTGGKVKVESELPEKIKYFQEGKNASRQDPKRL